MDIFPEKFLINEMIINQVLIWCLVLKQFSVFVRLDKGEDIWEKIYVISKIQKSLSNFFLYEHNFAW